MIRPIFTGKILSSEKINSYIYEVWISLDMPFIFKAGQFISLFISNNDARSYSVASPPRIAIEQKKIRLLIGPKPDGLTAQFLQNIKQGDGVKFRGGFGIFTIERTIPDIQNISPDSDLIFAATGTGIAPMLSMIKYLEDIQIRNRIVVYYGLRNVEDIILKSEFEDLKSKMNFDYKYCISQFGENTESEDIKSGYVQKQILQYQKNNDYVYICGATNTVSQISQDLRSNNYLNLFFENYG